MITCLVIIKANNNFLLFIRKKRGLGKGLITFPGGKVEDNEKIEECAIREVKEEVNITIFEPKLVGKIKFYLNDYEAETTYVFVTDKYEGKPEETDEAIPIWLNYIPYEEMWEDDKVWLPLVLEGKKICCEFKFDKNWQEFKGGYCNLCELT
ncbi:8-oxo-dGTP diphosphatase [Sulfurisphaera ohwakuensis]|uniref:8-oxo-dGTP diphosphatase n=1 Tax=Sulfurisphaera ohwakuensis TaxID=69656 RepID=UPI0036F42DEE